MNPLERLQEILDNLFYPEGIHTHWQSKAESDNDNPDEYFVYALNGEDTTSIGDNEIATAETYITLRYYYKRDILDNYQSRKKVQNRIFKVMDELRKQKFSIPDGPFDTGIIEDKSLKETDYNMTLFELVYQRLA